MRLLQRSSAAQPLLFLLVSSTDHVTGLTGATPTVTLSKNGAAFAAPTGAVTELGSGWYKVAGNATDTNTLGPLILHATATGADPCDVEYEVVAFDPQTAWDATIATRASQASVDTIDDYVDTEMAAALAAVDTEVAAILAAVAALPTATLAAAAVWTYATRTLTQSAAAVAAAVSGSTLTIRRGDTWSASLTDVGSLTGNTKLWFTAKRDPNDTDAQSLIQIERTVGLVYLNAAAATAGQGSLTVDDAATGDVTLVLAAAATATLPVGSYSYDIQMLTASGVTTRTEGVLNVTSDITLAVS